MEDIEIRYYYALQREAERESLLYYVQRSFLSYRIENGKKICDGSQHQFSKMLSLREAYALADKWKNNKYKVLAKDTTDNAEITRLKNKKAFDKECLGVKVCNSFMTRSYELGLVSSPCDIVIKEIKRWRY